MGVCPLQSKQFVALMSRTFFILTLKIEPHLGQKAITSVVQVADNTARNCHFSVWSHRDGSHARWWQTVIYQCSGAEPLSHDGQPREKDRSCCARANRVNPKDMFRLQSTSYERTYCWEWSTMPADDYWSNFMKWEENNQSIEVNQCWHYGNYIHLYETPLPVN